MMHLGTLEVSLKGFDGELCLGFSRMYMYDATQGELLIKTDLGRRTWGATYAQNRVEYKLI